MRERFVALQEDRLDRCVAGSTQLSRKKARSLIGKGGVRIDGTITTHPAAHVPVGAVVEVRTVADRVETPKLPIRYEDRGLLVVDKPAGLPSQGTAEGTRVHVYGILSEAERYVGLHHRLDTPASGLLLVTRSPDMNVEIAKGFREGGIKRNYLIVVVGDPGPEGDWTTPIDGEDAHSRFRRISTGAGMSLVEVALKTGRTHQIRKHAAEAGHPVVGDRRYGGYAARAWSRLALHAWKLRFWHPVSRQRIQVLSPIPLDLQDLVLRVGGLPDDIPLAPPEEPSDDEAEELDEE